MTTTQKHLFSKNKMYQKPIWKQFFITLLRIGLLVNKKGLGILIMNKVGIEKSAIKRDYTTHTVEIRTRIIPNLTYQNYQ